MYYLLISSCCASVFIFWISCPGVSYGRELWATMAPPRSTRRCSFDQMIIIIMMFIDLLLSWLLHNHEF